MRRLKLWHICLGVLAFAMHSCFTGVESTPRIKPSSTDNLPSTKLVGAGALAEVVDEPPAQWMPGKLFYVTDNRIALCFESLTPGVDSLAGEFITYKGCEEITSVTGDKNTRLHFTDKNGNHLHTRISMPVETFMQRDRMYLPFCIEMSVVEKAASVLKGNTYYITTSQWFDPVTDKGIANSVHFIPVVVSDVLPGNDNYALKVVFQHKGLDGDSEPRQAAVFVSTDPSRLATRGFGTMFSVDNPRKQHSKITADTWRKIMNSEVAEGMTRDECRLALGSPYNLVRDDNSAGAFEYWSYTDGTYLIFQDNLLLRYRK